MINTPTFTAVIPLYNKREWAVRAVRSAAGQSFAPVEVLVVDDGSTDGGGDVVEQLGLPLVRVIRQVNAGVSAARNRGIAEAKGEYVAFLDADDWWDEDFLHHIANLTRHWPGCGIYSTGFWIHRRNGVYINEHSIKISGVVKDYFRTAFGVNITWTGSLAIPRSVFDDVGGFPEGMARGQDLYMWTKVAVKYPVCYTPTRMSNYNLLTVNNSRTGYKLERQEYSFMDFYTPGNDDLNEYIARIEIGLGILQSVGGYTVRALKTEKSCSYTRRYRFGWWKLYILNRLPAGWRGPLLEFYKKAVWLVSRKGVME